MLVLKNLCSLSLSKSSKMIRYKSWRWTYGNNWKSMGRTSYWQGNAWIIRQRSCPMFGRKAHSYYKFRSVGVSSVAKRRKADDEERRWLILGLDGFTTSSATSTASSRAFTDSRTRRYSSSGLSGYYNGPVYRKSDWINEPQFDFGSRIVQFSARLKYNFRTEIVLLFWCFIGLNAV